MITLAHALSALLSIGITPVSDKDKTPSFPCMACIYVFQCEMDRKVTGQLSKKVICRLIEEKISEDKNIPPMLPIK